MSQEMIDLYSTQQKKFTEWVQSPSLFMEKEEEPELIKRRKIKSFKTGIASLGVFGDDNHTAWHTFEKTMTTKEFSDTMSGKLFSKT